MLYFVRPMRSPICSYQYAIIRFNTYARHSIQYAILRFNTIQRARPSTCLSLPHTTEAETFNPICLLFGCCLLACWLLFACFLDAFCFVCCLLCNCFLIAFWLLVVCFLVYFVRPPGIRILVRSAPEQCRDSRRGQTHAQASVGASGMKKRCVGQVVLDKWFPLTMPTQPDPT